MCYDICMSVSFPPAQVTQKRYELYERFVNDDDMPADIRDAAKFYFEAYKQQDGVGDAMAGELVWQLIVYAVADPMERMKMVLHGQALRAQNRSQEKAGATY